MVALGQRGRIRHAVHFRGDGNISLDLDIERVEVVTQELASGSPLDPSTVRAGLHLHVLQVRRERAGLGQEVGVAKIRVDVVGGVATVGTILQAKCREEATDNGEARADQADGGLDVCPQGGLVDGVCRVGRADPEEHDDAVYTGEADEGAEGKDTIQSELVLPGTMQVPNHRDGEGEDHKVHQHVPGLVDDEKAVGVNALAFNAMIPVGAQWDTLTGAGEEYSSSPGANETV